jgi:hypothetical protein
VALIPTRAGRPFLFPRFQPVYDAVGNNEKIYHVALTQFGAVCDRQSTREKIGVTGISFHVCSDQRARA